MKIIYDFKVKKFLNMLKILSTLIESALLKAFVINRFEKTLRNFIIFVINIKTFVINYHLIYMNVKDVIDFVLMKMKKYYDKHHQFIFFKVDDFIKFRLYRGYELFKISIKLR